jgi:carbamoyltransferase
VLILGLNAFHADASAALWVDGALVGAVEEERLTRVKHESGVPTESVRWLLESNGLTLADVDHVAVSRDPHAHRARRTATGVARVLRERRLPRDQLAGRRGILGVGRELADGLGVALPDAQVLHHVEHHPAHIASAFYASGLDSAAVCSVDGLGDSVSMAWGVGRDRKLELSGRVWFPHSLGYFYTAITQLLGFPYYGDEYKVMGLAPYGEPRFLPEMRRILRDHRDRFRLGAEFFRHFRETVEWRVDGGPPVIGSFVTPAMEALLGPVRHPDEPLTEHHRDVAASAQARLEEVLVPMLTRLQRRTGERALAMAGGVALNVTANTHALRTAGFDTIWVQPAASDAGTSIGSALYVAHRVLDRPRQYAMEHAYLGPRFDTDACAAAADAAGLAYEVLDEDELCRRAAASVADGAVLGWFQGSVEFGPRALGNRSIVCDPRRPDMKEHLNTRTKRREGFRPFAPSVLAERAAEIYELDAPSPYMLFAPKVRAAWADRLPAVTHVDGTGRVQTVDRATNPRYWRLISEFDRLTGVPVVLNTSFNEHEPIVCTPEEAVACFLRADIDVLVMEDVLVARST